MAYLWTPLMPFALKRASGHVGSKGSSFDSWALLGGCFVHHVVWRIATELMLGDVRFR